MKYQITVYELKDNLERPHSPERNEIYDQIVEEFNLQQVIAVVNKLPIVDKDDNGNKFIVYPPNPIVARK